MGQVPDLRGSGSDGGVCGNPAILETVPLTGGRRLWCHTLAATFMSVFIAAPLIMIFDRRDPINIEAISLMPNRARAGDTMTMRWSATIHRAGCSGVVIRRYIGAVDKVIRETVGQPTVFRGTAGKKTEDFEIQFVVPNNLGPGPYTYEPLVKRWCNPLQQHLWPIVTHQMPVEFTVVP